MKSTTQKPETCFAKNLLRSMCNRFDLYKENNIYIIAMLIDPRFKGLMLNKNELLQAKLHITQEVEKYRYNYEILSQSSTSDELSFYQLKNLKIHTIHFGTYYISVQYQKCLLQWLQ